jgi:hypothetical protein
MGWPANRCGEPVRPWEPSVKHFTMLTMPDPTDDLITLLMAITRDPSLAPPSGRLRPLLVGRPHPKRRLRRWGAQATISAALARSKAAASPAVLAQG